MSLKFEDWLVEQQGRKDHVGAFARGLNVDGFAEKSSRRKHNEHATWVDVVIAMGQPEYVISFNVAWQEFTEDKAAVEADAEAAAAEAEEAKS